MVSVEVRFNDVVADPCRIALPLQVTHGRSTVTSQPDPSTASILWDGEDCPYKVGDRVEIWVTIPYDAALYDDPAVTYDSTDAVYDSAWNTGDVAVRRFVGMVAGMTASARLGVVTGWELECVADVARLGYLERTLTRPAESDVARVQAIASAIPPFPPTLPPVTILGDPGVTLAAGEISGNVLGLLHDVTTSSGGLVWQSADGQLTYETAAHRVADSQPVGVVPCEVIDSDLSWLSNVEDIINDVTVTWGPSDAQQEVRHQDEESKLRRWGERATTINTTLAAEADADQLANLVLARRAWPFYGTSSGVVNVENVDAGRLFYNVDIGTPVLIPIPAEPGPTPSEPTTVVVEGWVETWAPDGPTVQLAFSDQKRWVLTQLRDYDNLRGQTYAHWQSDDYLNALVQEAA